MPPQAQATRLLSQQTRLIHARAGLRLKVLQGRLWLTQPHVAEDLFLIPGDQIDLHQDWVIIGADAEPRPVAGEPEFYGEYVLEPLLMRSSRLGTWARMSQWFRQWARHARDTPAETKSASVTFDTWPRPLS